MNAIVAIDKHCGLSKNGTIPWNIKSDMKFFQKKTENNIVIMGRSTFFSLPEKNRPLKKRINIVLTHNPEKYDDLVQSNLLFTNEDNISSVIDEVKKSNPTFSVYIIGGNQIYEKYLHFCDNIFITHIKEDYCCDLFLCCNDILKDYRETIIEENNKYTIIHYKRLKQII